ncbi:hypothetical protein EDB86DRAFT_698394 [Lactarius hatsudake]|nr:hypothetical protein EDB86DRAFT_698394 [Lactarius hatsudake]
MHLLRHRVTRVFEFTIVSFDTIVHTVSFPKSLVPPRLGLILCTEYSDTRARTQDLMFCSYDMIRIGLFQGTFLVDGSFYCVHGSSFLAIPPDSAPVTMNHEFLTLVVSLGHVERENFFEALLSVIYPKAQSLISTMEITCPCARASPLFAGWQRSSSNLQRHTTGSCFLTAARQMHIEDVRGRVLRVDGTKLRELKKLYWPETSP